MEGAEGAEGAEGVEGWRERHIRKVVVRIDFLLELGPRGCGQGGSKDQ